MTTVLEICDAVSRIVLVERLGVGRAAISNAVSANKMPAAWYFVVNSLCEEIEHECPSSLFSFIGTDDAPKSIEVSKCVD